MKSSQPIRCAAVLACLCTLSACSGQPEPEEPAATSAVTTVQEVDESSQEMDASDSETKEPAQDPQEPAEDEDSSNQDTDDSESSGDGQTTSTASVPDGFPAEFPLPDAPLISAEVNGDDYLLYYLADSPAAGEQLIEVMDSDPSLTDRMSIDGDVMTVTYNSQGHAITVSYSTVDPYYIYYTVFNE